LDKWTASLSDNDDFTKLQSLWTYQTLNTPNFGLLTKLLHAKDPGVRTASTRVLAAWLARPAAPSPASAHYATPRDNAPPLVGEGGGEGSALPLLRALISDDHPRVRLEAVRALATIPTPQSAELVLTLLDHPMDRFLDYALYLTLSDLEPAWLPAFQSGQLTFDHNPKKLEFALKASRNPAAIKPLVAALQANKITPESRKDIVDLIAQLGGPEDLAVLFEAALTPSDSGANTAGILASLDRAARARNVKPTGDLARLERLFRPLISDIPVNALRLAGAWKLAQLKPQVVGLASVPSPVNPAVRTAAIATLADLSDKATLTRLATAPQPRDTRVTAVASLAGIDPRAAAPLAAALLTEDGPDTDLAPALASFIKKKDGSKFLGEALKSKPPTADNAKLALRAIYALGNSDPALIQPLQSAAGITSQPKQLSPEEMKQLIADVQSKGDPARGEDVFRRADTSCLKCHSIAGAGGQLAPDLSSLGSSPVDYIIDAILQPNKAIKEGYHAVIVETNDGDQITGIKIRQSETALILRDAVQDEIAIPLNTIKGKPREAASMMPAGLADPLTRQELIDLIRFLSELGRPGPFAVGAKPVARRWELLDSPQTTTAKPNQPLQLKPEIWTPAYANVSGDLPIPAGKPALVRCQINVTTGGQVRPNPTPASTPMWIDNNPTTNPTIDLKPGVHTVTLLASNPTLRLELAEVPGSPAKAQFVTGR
jgi:putative heme-binding domain-containing protein